MLGRSDPSGGRTRREYSAGRRHISIARRIGIIPTLLPLTIVIRSCSGSCSGGNHAYGHSTAHWSAAINVVSAAVVTADVTRATAPTSGQGFVRNGRDTRDADDKGDNPRYNGPMRHDWLPF